MYLQSELERFEGKLVKVTLMTGTIHTGIFHNMYRMGVRVGQTDIENFFIDKIEVL